MRLDGSVKAKRISFSTTSLPAETPNSRPEAHCPPAMSPVTLLAITALNRERKGEGIHAKKTVLQIAGDDGHVDGATLLRSDFARRSLRLAIRVQSIHARLRCVLCAATGRTNLLQGER